MSIPFWVAIRITQPILILSIGGLISCRSQQTVHVLSYVQGRALSLNYQHHYNPRQQSARWLGPPPAFTRFRRTNPADAPVIVGCVDVQEENGKFTPMTGAVITVDGAHTFTNTTGNYIRAVGLGLHDLRAGGVGFLWSEAPSFYVERGDSIQINFHLLPEFRPTMN